MTRKVCVISGTRAEYGLLFWLLKSIQDHTNLTLQLIATGSHLSQEHGATYQLIEADGFKIDCKIDMLLSSNSAIGISKSMGLAQISLAEHLDQLSPDIVVLLGDRFEILSAATTAMIGRIPIAHIHGGEATEGLIDEAIRHSITKMSHLHFTATETYKNRVIQLGENPERVFNVGGIGLDNIKKLALLSQSELEKSLDFSFNKKNLLITFHPVTLEDDHSEQQFNALLASLDKLENTLLIFTKANADAGGKVINQLIDDYVLANPHAIAFFSMGQLNYLSAMQYIDGVVGNSSSGLIETPSFKKGTINIGDRQKGRIKADSVIDCEPTENSITTAIKKLYSNEFQQRVMHTQNPYEKDNTSQAITDTLAEFPLKGILKKSFYDININA